MKLVKYRFLKDNSKIEYQSLINLITVILEKNLQQKKACYLKIQENVKVILLKKAFNQLFNVLLPKSKLHQRRYQYKTVKAFGIKSKKINNIPVISIVFMGLREQIQKIKSMNINLTK